MLWFLKYLLVSLIYYIAAVGFSTTISRRSTTDAVSCVRAAWAAMAVECTGM